MDLLCLETSNAGECLAYPDPALLADDRALNNLLQSEDRYAPSASYFGCVQKDISPTMRKIVAEWMLEVCEDQKCQEDVFALSMNYVDRFLSICPIKKSQLQLLGTACLLLASKLRAAKPISTDDLIYYTDFSITIDELWRWEQLVVSKLKWDLSAVTPCDFLLYILARLPIDPNFWDSRMVRRHAQTFIALSAREYKFSMYTPSMIAAASVAAALHGLDWTGKSGFGLAGLLKELTRITAIEQDYLRGCLEQIEEMVRSGGSQASASSDSNNGGNDSSGAGDGGSGGSGNQYCQQTIQTNQVQHHNSHHHHHHDHYEMPLDEQEITTTEKLLEYEKATTPTDVRDIHF